MSELQDRIKALKLALERSEAEEVKWPTVEMPRSGFKRLPKVDESYGTS